MPRAFLLPTYWADDPVSGIQAVEHGIETFLIKAQAPLVLLDHQLLCNNTAQQNSLRACWAAQAKLLARCRLGFIRVSKNFYSSESDFYAW